jgi:hypothetical protein
MFYALLVISYFMKSICLVSRLHISYTFKRKSMVLHFKNMGHKKLLFLYTLELSMQINR